MPAARPLSALRPALFDMADAAQKANVEVVRRSTTAVAVLVETSGRRFVLRGRRGRRVPLVASSDVKAFGEKPVGMVRGVPEGFWHIVTYGSAPHLITTGRSKAGGRMSARTTFRRFGDGDSLGALAPVRTPWGPRQYVNHPGHRTIGHPWQQAMEAAPQAVAETQALTQAKALFDAFM